MIAIICVFNNLCVYLSCFVAMIDACTTTNALFSKLSISSINIGIISYNDFITYRAAQN